MNLNPPQGSRDFNADILHKRQEIIEIIKTTFELYCYEPLETPAMEYTQILEGKYGEEGDKLIFRVLNSGNPLEGISETISHQPLKDIPFSNLKSALTEKALRYDLTIPFARYVANHHNKINFPYKRYQIQPVWRGDRPQKGRYREFYQCDADVVGKPEHLQNFNYEKELIHIYYTVFKQLEIPVIIRMNHREILHGIVEMCNQDLIHKGFPTITDTMFCGILDKLDKIGWHKVSEILSTQMNLNSTILNFIKDLIENNTLISQNIINEIPEKLNNGWKKILDIHQSFEELKNIKIDFSLARGLNYYTGMIVEVVPDFTNIPTHLHQQIANSSIGGGGRYDQLTTMFGVPNICGMGISFGLDRIFDIKESLGNWKSNKNINPKVLFLNLGDFSESQIITWVQSLRNEQVACDMFPTPVKIDKQFKYAEDKQFKYAIIVGQNEFENGTFILKNLITRKQEVFELSNMIKIIKNYTPN